MKTTVANHIAVQKKERNEIKPRKLRSMRRRITTQKIVVVVVAAAAAGAAVVVVVGCVMWLAPG